MSIRRRNLGQGILYIFNGSDFTVNSGLPAGEYEKVLAFCREYADQRGTGGKKQGRIKNRIISQKT